MRYAFDSYDRFPSKKVGYDTISNIMMTKIVENIDYLYDYNSYHFSLNRVVGRAKESRSHRSEATLDDMNETDPANAKMNTSDEDQEVDKDSDYISHSTDSKPSYNGFKSRMSEWVSWAFTKNTTKFTSIPGENDNSFSAELGECQSNDEFVKRNNKNGENRNLVFSSSTFSPIAPVVKYDTSRPN